MFRLSLPLKISVPVTLIIILVILSLVLATSVTAVPQAKPRAPTYWLIPATPFQIVSQAATQTPSSASTPRASSVSRPSIQANNAKQVEQISRIGNGTVRQCAWSADGQTLVLAGAMLQVWDTQSGTSRTLGNPSDYTVSVAFSPNGTQLAAGYENG